MKVQISSLMVLLGLTTACAKFPSTDSLSVDSISKVKNMQSIGDMKPTLGNVDIAEAASAAKDISKAALISDEEITKMALGYASVSDKKNRLAQEGSSYVKRLNKLTAKHRNEDGLNLNFKVYLGKEINAFSLADGSVRVYSGLMDMMNDDELLAVIGHEIGHVKLGHSSDRIRLANLASGVRKGVGSTSSIAGAVANEDMFGGFLEKVVNSQFSQSQETDSDEYSVAFMKRNGYKLDGEITAFNKLAELEGKSGFVDGLLSSHPASEDRAKHLAEIIGDSSNVKIVAKADSEKPVTSAKQDIEKPVISAKQDIEKPVSNAKHASLKSQQEVENVSTSFADKPARGMKVSSSNSLTPGWYVQVSAETNKSRALQVEDKFQYAGFKTAQQQAVVNGVNYHRIVVGPFNQYSQAQNAKQKMLDSAISKEEPFIRVVK